LAPSAPSSDQPEVLLPPPPPPEMTVEEPPVEPAPGNQAG
jgi:hypothetical protein